MLDRTLDTGLRELPQDKSELTICFNLCVIASYKPGDTGSAVL